MVFESQKHFVTLCTDQIQTNFEKFLSFQEIFIFLCVLFGPWRSFEF